MKINPSETLPDAPEQVDHDDDSLALPVETVFHGTSVEAAKAILEDGFQPAPHAHRPELGPVSWFSTESTLAGGYGQDTRVRDANGMLTIVPGGSGANAPSYNVVIEAEIPKSSDPRGFNAFEGGIEYVGTTRLVTAVAMSKVAIRAIRLYEHKPTADGRSTTSGKLIEEHRLHERQSVLGRLRNKIRRKKNSLLGRPTLGTVKPKQNS